MFEEKFKGQAPIPKRPNRKQNQQWHRLIGSAGRIKKNDLNNFTDPFNLIWMKMTKMKLVKMKG